MVVAGVVGYLPGLAHRLVSQIGLLSLGIDRDL